MKYATIVKKHNDGTLPAEKSSRVIERKKREFTTSLGKLKDQRDTAQDKLDDMLLDVNMSPDEINKLDIELAMLTKKIELTEKRILELF